MFSVVVCIYLILELKKVSSFFNIVHLDLVAISVLVDLYPKCNDLYSKCNNVIQAMELFDGTENKAFSLK